MNTITVVDPEGVSLDFEQVNPRKEDAGKGGEGVTTPADLETPKSQSEESVDEPAEDSTSNGVENLLRMLGLAVIGRAIEDGNRDWFFSSRSRDIFRFWCQVSRLNPDWVQRRVEERSKDPAHSPGCPGLFKVGQTWWLQIHHEGRRHRVRIGRDLDWPAAVELGKVQREAVKQNVKVMTAGL